MNGARSIANMPRKAAVPRTPEARILRAAVESSGLSHQAIAEQLGGVDPSLISQFCTGHRPVPASKAVKLASLVGANPAEISAAYREVLQQSQGNVAPLPVATGARDERELGLVLARLENDVHALNLALGALTAVMVRHRPAEAAEAAQAIRRRVPAKYRDRGLLHELLSMLDKAAQV